MRDDWQKRLTEELEPHLRKPDPRPDISTYHDMPYAIFRYSPEEEFAVRYELGLLQTRLEQVGKRITTISLAERLQAALDAEGMDMAELVDAEVSVGIEPTIDTYHQIISEYQPIDELVVDCIPADADPLVDIVFIARAGALFPICRTSALLDQMKGRIEVPAILFYPGELDGPSGLRFMGVLDAEHSYRPKIY